jgi:RNA polymerase sigma-70 factor (ECF subfamily)
MIKKVYTDSQIVEGCLKNDRKFQEILYKKFFPECYYMCLRYTKDQDIAKLIVHDGLLKVYMKLNLFQGSGSLRSWIKRIVFNALSDHFRKESKYLKLIVFEQKDEVHTSAQLDKLYYEDLVKLVDHLDYRQREVFMLYAIEGYSHKEIADIMHITEGNSKWHLYQARNKLKEMVNRQKLKNHA